MGPTQGGGGGFGGGYQPPSYYGGSMYSGPQQMGGGMGQGMGQMQPQYRQPPSFAQLFGGGNNYQQQLLNSANQYYGQGQQGQQAQDMAAMQGYGAPYNTFPNGMGGSGGNMYQPPGKPQGPVADPAGPSSNPVNPTGASNYYQNQRTPYNGPMGMVGGNMFYNQQPQQPINYGAMTNSMVGYK